MYCSCYCCRRRRCHFSERVPLFINRVLRFFTLSLNHYEFSLSVLRELFGSAGRENRIARIESFSFVGSQSRFPMVACFFSFASCFLFWLRSLYSFAVVPECLRMRKGTRGSQVSIFAVSESTEATRRGRKRRRRKSLYTTSKQVAA